MTYVFQLNCDSVRRRSRGRNKRISKQLFFQQPQRRTRPKNFGVQFFSCHRCVRGLTRHCLPSSNTKKYWHNRFVSHSAHTARLCHVHASLTRSFEINASSPAGLVFVRRPFHLISFGKERRSIAQISLSHWYDVSVSAVVHLQPYAPCYATTGLSKVEPTFFLTTFPCVSSDADSSFAIDDFFCLMKFRGGKR